MTEMLRYNTGKPQYTQLPSSFFRLLFEVRAEDLNIQLINDVTKVGEFGAQKYAKNNWRVGGSWCKVAESGLRHLLAYIDGETHDSESKLPHLAHAGWNLMALVEFQTHGIGQDDRYMRPLGQKIVEFDEESPDTHIIFDMLFRWCEGGDDTLLWHALAILNDTYGEEPTNDDE